MAQVKQITLTALSKPGVLAKICGVLSGAGVNLVAISATDGDKRSKLRMVVSDPVRAKHALTAAKIRYGTWSLVASASRPLPASPSAWPQPHARLVSANAKP